MLSTFIYAKSLFKNAEYTKVFTLLQLEYSKAPHYTSLLYLYGKHVVMSSQKEFFGSGMGALDECLRSCLPSRHATVKFYQGIGHEQLGRQVRAFAAYQDYFDRMG